MIHTHFRNDAEADLLRGSLDSLFVVWGVLTGDSPDYIIFEINIWPPQITTDFWDQHTHQMGHLRAKANQISMLAEVRAYNTARVGPCHSVVTWS